MPKLRRNRSEIGTDTRDVVLHGSARPDMIESLDSEVLVEHT